MSTLGSRIKALRKARRLTQMQLADKVGLTQGAISMVEQGKTETVTHTTLLALCEALATTPDFLIANQGDRDSIQSAIDEAELIYLWRGLPDEGRRLVLEQAASVGKVFPKTKA